MQPDADAGKSAGKRSDPFAPLTSQVAAVGDGHEIYVETSAAPTASAVYLHGGPAAAAARSPPAVRSRAFFTAFCSISVARPEPPEKAVASTIRCRI